MSEAADFSIRVPHELEGGSYASFLHAWHTAHEFTLDFCAPLPAEASGAEDYRLVSRLRIPVTVVFDFLRILNEAMSVYEQKYGEIRRPEDR